MCWLCRILPALCEGLCRTGGTIGGLNSESPPPPFVWTDRQQTAFEALKACLISAPILGFPTEDGRFLQDTDASLFAVGGGGGGSESTARRSGGGYRVCQPQFPLVSAALLHNPPGNVDGSGDVHAFPIISAGGSVYPSYDHSSLRWLQKFRNEDGMLARWYLLLGQFSFTFEYRPGAQHANADGMSRQCGQCQRSDCPVSSSD